jgi:hypothetical protein
MAIGGGSNKDVDGTIHRLQNQLDTAVTRTTELHRTGAHEEAVLAETAVSYGAASALEVLTGETVESQLERQESGGAPAPPPAVGRRWFRRRKVVRH